MNGGKRIAILLPNLSGGGVERVRLLLAQQFLAKGFAVDIVLAERRGQLLSEVPQGCRIVSLDAPRLRSTPWLLRKYFLEERPDAVLAGMWPFSGLAALGLQMARLPSCLVVSEHNDLRQVPAIKPLERMALRLFGRWIYSRASKIVAVSRGVRDSLCQTVRLPGDRIEIIYNPIRQSISGAIEPGDADLMRWWQQAAIKLIAVGSLKAQKDYPTLLKAVAQLVQTVDARLIVLGEGTEREALEQFVERSGLTNAVRFPGFRNSPQPYLAEANVFVLSSCWEGLGNVITEALFSGCRVVSTDCPSGPAELLDHGTYGRLVPVGDPVRLAEAIANVAAAPHDPKPGVAWAARFSPEVAARAYLDLLFPS